MDVRAAVARGSGLVGGVRKGPNIKRPLHLGGRSPGRGTYSQSSEGKSDEDAGDDAEADDQEQAGHDSAPAWVRSAGAGFGDPLKMSRPCSVPIRTHRKPAGGDRLDDGEQ
jgi:hypothetical protein